MDQTKFSQSQEIFQAPPEDIAKREAKNEAAKHPAEVVVKPAKNKKMLFLLGLVGVLVLLLGVLIIVSMSKKPPVDNGGPEVVLPTNPPKPQTEFGKKLEQLNTQINDSDPAKLDLDPPPLNYDIEL